MAIAIIAEYNPFHNGHIYQLNYVKQHFPNDEIIIILTGNYTQRGEIAVANFETRKEFALKYGASKVIELPFQFATQAAHIFAEGAIKLIYENKINKLIFGSESDNIDNLYFLANLIKDNEDNYNKLLKGFLKQGFSFPNAAASALESLSGQKITLPNDILGFEYVKQIVFHNYPIQAFCLKRTIDFHSENTTENFASASLLRKMITDRQDISKFSPMKFNKKPFELQDLYPVFQKVVNETPAEKLKQIKMISEGMENLFKKHIDAKSLAEFINRTNSKRYTTSRIKRAVLYVTLEVYDFESEDFKIRQQKYLERKQ